ncbi:MAG: RDD family protein, partial [Candidatus Thermoplasmatota archaeon]|nr:RDD family protein [Candidatus Thermoplasmatota archaeon]
MRLHPDLDEFKYDLKENTGRRVIAGLIDHVLLLLPIILIAGFITVAMNSMNPVALIIGPIAGLLPYSVYGPTPPHILVSMIAFPIVQLIIIVPYFTFLESSGRRTLGKRAMHLEVLNKKERYPTKTQAFMRNLMKFVIGTISIYLLGVLGWAVIIGVTGLLDLKMKPGSKNDVRQRLTEVKYGTMVFLEDDALSFGSIFLPGQKIAEKKGRGSMSRKSKSTIVMGKKKGRSKLPKRNAPAQLSPAESEKDAGIEKAPDLSLGSQDRKEPEPDTAGTEEGDMDQEEEKEPAEKKAPFWKKLFGGSGFTSSLSSRPSANSSPPRRRRPWLSAAESGLSQ